MMATSTIEQAPKTSTPAGAPPQITTGTNFTSSTCGQQQGVAAGPPLKPNAGYLAINGNTNLSSCVVGTSGASLTYVYLVQNSGGHFQYTLNVYGQGPAGAGSGDLKLVFTDQTNDQYTLKLDSSSLKWHTLDYNSNASGIVELAWGP